jgi:hypothetical protein
VKLLSVASTRHLYQLLITCPSKLFNRRRNFVGRDSHLGTEGLVEYRSFKDPNCELVRQRQEISVQSTPETTDATTQSAWSRKVNSSAQTQYITMLPELAKILQEQDDFLDFARKIQERVTPVLDANLASDVFKDQLALLIASDDSLVKSFSVSQLK